MAAVKVVHRLVCRARRRRGARRRWARRRGATSARPSLLCAVAASSDSAGQSRGRQGAEMSRSLKKGPFVSPKLLKKVEQMNRSGERRVIKTWSRASTVFPQFVGSHDCRARRSPACACVHHRKHGGPQVGRVCADAVLPWTYPVREIDARAGLGSRTIERTGNGETNPWKCKRLPNLRGSARRRRGWS